MARDPGCYDCHNLTSRACARHHECVFAVVVGWRNVREMVLISGGGPLREVEANVGRRATHVMCPVCMTVREVKVDA